MKQNKTLKTILFCIIAGTCINVDAYAPTSFFRPHDIDFRIHEWKKSNLRLGAALEYGETSKCRDWDENKHNVMQLYNPTESSVAMLLGTPAGSTIDALAKALGISAATATDDGYRGRFILTGEYEELDLTLFAKYKLPINLGGTFELIAYLPIKSMEFNNVKWCDKTKDVLSADKEFKEQVSSQIATKAKELGCLDINSNGWSNSGIGDVIVQLGWHKDFKQLKTYLKNVRIHTKVGVSIPTGEERDENQSLSLPMGNDGAWGIPGSLGLDLDFINHIRAGIEFDVFALFNSSKVYRMKTSRYQTDFLLLHKGNATKSQGPTWRFNLFAQAKKIVTGLSGMVNYQFLKHDENRLSPKSYDFDYNIVNSAESLKEWNSHHFVFSLAYGPYDTDAKAKVKPQIGVFYKLPITGKRVITSQTFGLQLAVNF